MIRHSLYLAWKYLAYHRLRTVTLVACITLIAVLPLSLELILKESEHQLVARAEATPLLFGARGSALDLVMNSLYFSDEIPNTTTMAAVDEIAASGLAGPIPLYVRFRARGFPIVGTTLDYLDYRGLQLAKGNHFALLGECVIGAEVAEKLGLDAGDHLLSSPETLFNIAGIYPLKMKIAGVLKPTNSADDLGVFTDVDTTMVIQGLSHGHEDLARTTDPTLIIERTDSSIRANAKLVEYTEITSDNIDSFHPHGDPADFPLTGIIALPHDEKSGTILRGRYINADDALQVVRPGDVIDTLMVNIFRIRNLIDAVVFTVGIATLLALVLVFSLSLRLRQREIDTALKLGCSRATIARLLGAEIMIILLFSAAVAVPLLILVSRFAQPIVRSLFM
ncbi:MAG: ABC transporter permease [Rhodothermales bacterium]